MNIVYPVLWCLHYLFARVSYTAKIANCTAITRKYQMKHYRAILAGLGNIGLNFLRLLVQREAIMQTRYGLAVKIVGVADSSGILTSDRGLDIEQIIGLKQQRM